VVHLGEGPRDMLGVCKLMSGMTYFKFPTYFSGWVDGAAMSLFFGWLAGSTEVVWVTVLTCRGLVADIRYPALSVGVCVERRFCALWYGHGSRRLGLCLFPRFLMR